MGLAVIAAAIATQEADIAGGDLEGSAGRPIAAGEDHRPAGGGVDGQPVAGDQHAVALLDVLIGGLGYAAPGPAVLASTFNSWACASKDMVASCRGQDPSPRGGRFSRNFAEGRV